MKRRKFIRKSGMTAGGLVLAPWMLQSCAGAEKSAEGETATSDEPATAAEMFFDISLAEWSLHKALFDGKMTNMEFPELTKREFGITAVEYVNQFFKDKAKDQTYLGELKQRCADNGVESVLIMIDGEGYLGSTDDAERTTAIENHYKWVEAAKFLGCHSIRVNAHGVASAEEVHAAAVDGLGRLSTFAKDFDINIIVENHGGYSSDGSWMSGVIAAVGMDNCGTLPDFGNFMIDREKGVEYDRYKGVTELMPYAKGVSAKSHVFDESGNETNTDFAKMLQIVKDAGYRGYIGIEYEGSELDEFAGVRATKALLEKVGKAMG